MPTSTRPIRSWTLLGAATKPMLTIMAGKSWSALCGLPAKRGNGGEEMKRGGEEVERRRRRRRDGEEKWKRRDGEER